MRNAFVGSLLVVGLLAAPLVKTVQAAEVVGVHVGGAGLGFTVGNSHYYDRDHHRQSYTYPSDYRSYKHNKSWYRSHQNWNDQSHTEWYRR